MKLWISHSGGPEPQWFIVRPNSQGLEAELSSLRDAGRTVIGLDVEPYGNSERMRAYLKQKRCGHCGLAHDDLGARCICAPPYAIGGSA